jgi:predicted ester cyclase
MGTAEERIAANLAKVHEHAVHEHRRELPQLLATDHPAAVYEDVPRGLRWEGLKQVEAFYLELLGAFPDIRFDLVARRAGPDHVTEELVARATHKGPIRSAHGTLAPTGKPVTFRLCIVFPMMPDGRIGGETVYYDLAGIYRQLGLLPQGL